MKIKKILVSQPKPVTEKNPYYDLQAKYGVEVVFRPLIKVEGLTSREFRQSKVSITDHTAVIFTARTAIDHYFRLCQELRFKVPDTMKYFCVSEKVANYLQKYVQYRKRKIFVSPTGKSPELVPFIVKHSKEKFLFPMSDVHDSNNSVIEQCGVPYTPAVMYRTVSNTFEKGEPFDYDMIILFTPSGVHSLKKSFPRFKQGDIVLGAMGPKTIETLKEAGLRLDITTSDKVPSMVTAIDKYLEKEARKEEREAKKHAEEQAAEEARRREAKKLAATKVVTKKVGTPRVSASTTKSVAKKTITAAKPIAKKTVKPMAKAADAAKRAAEEAARKEAELFARRSAAAKKGAATRAAKKAAEEAAKRTATEEAARKEAELFARRSAAAKKGAATRAAKKAAEEAAKRTATEEAARKEAELFARRSAAAKKGAATRAAKKAAEETKKAAAKKKPAAKAVAKKSATKKAATTKSKK